MTDIELLPLPEWAACDETVADMSTTDVREAMSDYARANMEPLIAEIEALRAERDSFQRGGIAAQARAERLAEALRELEPFVQHHDSCGDHDAYNNSPFQTCGCGLDSLLERIAALRDHDQEVGNG